MTVNRLIVQHSLRSLPFSLSLIYSFFLLTISFLWIGAQFPQDNFLSFGNSLALEINKKRNVKYGELALNRINGESICQEYPR